MDILLADITLSLWSLKKSWLIPEYFLDTFRHYLIYGCCFCLESHVEMRYSGFFQCLGFLCLLIFILCWSIVELQCWVVSGVEQSDSVMCTCAKLLHLCLTLCDHMDCRPPGSSVHGILQARILEWAAMPSSRGSSRPRDWTWVSYTSCTGRKVLNQYHHLGSPIQVYTCIYYAYIYFSGSYSHISYYRMLSGVPYALQ